MMELINQIIDIFLHLDKHLQVVIQHYGVWTYLLLFLIVLMETGFVITPFLPGDSLLFAAGTFASPALGSALNVWLLWALLCMAAIAGDTINYWIGHYIGPKAFSGETRFLKKEYLDRTREFYEKHGGKTIVLARFIPIIRTFAPFVAGIGVMSYSRFIAYNVFGGIAWVSTFLFLGYRFGTLQIVQENFTYVVLAIILISVIPIGVEALRERARAHATQKLEV